MSLRYWFVIALVVCQTAGAQTPPKFLNPKFLNQWTSAEQPSVPADPLELAMNAVPVQSVEQRAVAIKLLDNAQFLSNVRRVPYDLKTHFTSAQGAWQMEDSSGGGARQLSMDGAGSVLLGRQPVSGQGDLQ